MRKRFWFFGLLALVFTVCPLARGNSFFSRAPQFNLPTGSIAFMGCYWSPLVIGGSGGDTSPPPQAPVPASPNANSNLYNSGNVKVGVDTNAAGQMLGDALIGDQAPPDSARAILDTDQAVVDKSTALEMPLMPVPYSTAYQNALLMHILNPAKWAYNPQITQFCGMRPYILIGIVDFCNAYPCSAKIQEKVNGQPVSYWGRRSVLEQDTDIFANRGKQHAVALEFFLVSTADGSTLWQGNLMTTGNKGSTYSGIEEGLVESALKNLLRK